MKKTVKAVLSSALSITLCASIIAGSTFALFTNESKTNIAITSGKVDLQATAAITRAYSSDWDEASSMYVEKNAEEASGVYTFTNTGTAQYVDGTLQLTNITPGDCVDFTITTTNNSSIAIKYRTVVTFVSGGKMTDDGKVNTEENDAALFHALNVTVNDVEGMENISSDRSTAVSDWSERVEPKGNIEDISVSIHFPTDGDTSLQGQSCVIAIGVYAVQYNGHDESKQDTYLVFSENLGDALGEVKDGDTLVLGGDVTMPEEGLKIEGNKDVNVDLFGNTFGVNKDTAESGEDLVVSKGSSLTIKDSAVGTDNKFTVNTNANSGNNPNDREHSGYTPEDNKYTMKVEGTLNFEDVDVEVNNKAGDIGICVDGGEINFKEGADLVINGREASDGYGENGFGKGFYVTNDGEVNLTDANVTSNGAVTSFLVGGEKPGTLNITGGTYNFKDMYNSVNVAHPTFVSAFQTYENGTIKIDNAEINLIGKAENKASTSLGGTENETEYTNMILICCLGGGTVDVTNSKLTLAPELGTAFAVQTVCSYTTTGTADDEVGCEHGYHKTASCNAHVTLGKGTEIYLNSAGHQTASDACFVFAASRNGKQVVQYSNDGNTYQDDVTEGKVTHQAQFADGNDIYTIKVHSEVKIYFSNVGPNASDSLQYYVLMDNKTPTDTNGANHEFYYLYDHNRVTGHQNYFKDLINKYNPNGVLFDYDLEG